jgi:glycosyltransferase involved in cell wall biosynthesis
MQIGFYTPNYPGLTTEGGIGSYTRTLAHGLAAAGHTVHVLTPGDRPAADDGPVRIHFVRTAHLPGFDRVLPGAGACWRTAWSIHQLVRDYRLEVFEVANWEGYALFYMHLPRVPTVVRLATSSRETQQIDGLPWSRWLAWDVKRERWQARAADALVTHSDAHRQLMATELVIPAGRIRLIPLAVEVFPEFVRPPRPPGPPTVVYLGRLEHRKGTVELLQAVPRVLQAVPDARFVLIGGDRPHCPGGRTHAQYLEQDFPPEVRRRVMLVGRLPQPEVDRWLQTADVFVAPSRYESFGLIFLEAMRWGTPVIGTTAGGIPEVVENGRSGVLVRPEALDELAAAIVRLLTDPQRRAALGAGGRRRAEQHFSVERMAQRTAQVYDEVIRGRQKRNRRRRTAHAE